MEAKYPEIVLGEALCIKIKNIYFDDKKWVDCHNEVAAKFSEFKVLMRKFYTDKSDLEILKDVSRYGLQDVADVFNCSM